MANPTHIPSPFARDSAYKNTIQKTRQPTQDEAELTWVDGVPLKDMTPIASGGAAPLGQDFNGALFAISDNTVYLQNANRYKWDQNVIDNYGGYQLGAIVQSDDSTCEYRSIVANNAVNPNNGLGGSWVVYSGVGSVNTASSTTAGIMKVINSLNSTDTVSALSAAQGKVLNDQSFGVGQTRKDVTSQRVSNQTYTNNTNKPIEVSVYLFGNGNNAVVDIYASNIFLCSLSNTTAWGTSRGFSFTVPPQGTYRINGAFTTITELS